MPGPTPSRRFPVGAIVIVLIIIGVPAAAIVLHASRSGRSVGETIREVVAVPDDEWTMERPSLHPRFARRRIGLPTTGKPTITHVTAADLDDDGLLDVLVSDAGANRIGWIRQTAPGQFSEQFISPAIIAPARTQAIDIDLDGDLDVLIAGLGSLFPTIDKLGTVIILEQAGGEFIAHTIAIRRPRIADVRAGDLDGDGDLDLAVAAFGADEGELFWMENTGGWTFVNHVLHRLSGTIDVIPHDLDRDGDLDLVCVVSQEWEEIYAFLNDGAGRFEQRLLYGASNDDYGSSGISLADLDADGDDDILYTNGDAFDYTPPRPRPWHGIQWLENDGALNFTFHRLVDYPGAYGSSAADFDGDGDLDIVAVSAFNEWESPAAQSVIWLENLGGAAFARHDIANDPTHQITVAVGDYNGDGRPDLVTGGIHFYPPYDRIGRVTLWTNTPPGTSRGTSP
jgi:hypothetical protein